MRGAIAVIRRTDQRFLVIERSRYVRAPGKLCFPGGEIESGESVAAAVTREVYEELQVSARPVRPLWQSVTESGVELAWWLARLTSDAPLTPNPREVARVCWLSSAEMLACADLLDSNRAFLTAVAQGDIQLEESPDTES